MTHRCIGRAAIVLIVLALVLVGQSGVRVAYAQEGREAMLARQRGSRPAPQPRLA